MENKIILIVKTESEESSKYNLYRLENEESIKEIICQYFVMLGISEVVKEMDITSINELLSRYNSGIKFEVFTDYENKFFTLQEKYELRDSIGYMCCHNHCINEETIFLWDYQRDEWADFGAWSWSNDINDIIDYYKYVTLDNLLGYAYKGNMTTESREELAINSLIQELIWNEEIEKTNKFGKIRDLLKELDADKTFEKLEYVVDEIQKQCKQLKIDCETYVFKGLKYPKMLVRAHGHEYDEMDLYKTFKEDYIA